MGCELWLHWRAYWLPRCGRRKCLAWCCLWWRRCH